MYFYDDFYYIDFNIIELKHSVAIGILSGVLTFISCIRPLLYTIVRFLNSVSFFNECFKSTAVLVLFGIRKLMDANIFLPLLKEKKVHIYQAVIVLGVIVYVSYFKYKDILLRCFNNSNILFIS
ncbi:MAG: hypothetical protein ACR5KW_04215 [Wolbachia sp.]